MPDFLMLRLRGVMQAWGDHTYEDYRPSLLFPTHSALTGLLGACFGVDRQDLVRQQALTDSFTYAVRADRSNYPLVRITDFHTVKEVRTVDRKVKKCILSHREYLCDVCYTVALLFKDSHDLVLAEQAVQKPYYTPVLGRRSCPLTAPLFIKVQTAENFHAALRHVAPHRGKIYSPLESMNQFTVRDQRVVGKREFYTRIQRVVGKREFYTRTLYIHQEEKGNDVSE